MVPCRPRTTDEAQPKPRKPWIWLSAVLAVVAAGLLIWALTLQSDLDSAQQDLESMQQELAGASEELDAAKQDLEALQSEGDDGVSTGAVVAGATALYKEFAEQLGATEDDLATTQQQLEEAERAAVQAEKDAEAARQAAADAGSETERAQAEAEQARAEVEAAEVQGGDRGGLREGVHLGHRDADRQRGRVRAGSGGSRQAARGDRRHLQGQAGTWHHPIRVMRPTSRSAVICAYD